MTEPDHDPDDRPTARLEQLHAELLATLLALPSSASTLDDAVDRLDYVLRMAAELRVRAEQAIGRFLLAHPDGGGRASACEKLPPGRGARAVLGCDRSTAMMLRRLAELPSDVVERWIDLAWTAGEWPPSMTAGTIVRGEREREQAKPGPSCAGSE